MQLPNPKGGEGSRDTSQLIEAQMPLEPALFFSTGKRTENTRYEAL